MKPALFMELPDREVIKCSIKDEEFWITNDDFGIQIDEVCIKMTDFGAGLPRLLRARRQAARSKHVFYSKTMDFLLTMVNFPLKMTRTLVQDRCAR